MKKNELHRTKKTAVFTKFKNTRMEKQLLKMLLCLLLGSTMAWAQTVTGKVTNASDGTGLPGVSVVVKGTMGGTTTDTDGNYSLTVPDQNSTLVFSFIGYATQEVAVNNRTSVKVSLAEDVKQLEEIVVTALGIERDKKSLTYAASEVGGEKLNTVKDPNPMNSLSGKVPGLFVTRSNSGAGGSVRVVLRGQKSTRQNQPLYVIDGVPIATINSTQTQDLWDTRDGGDIMSTLNPSDIESMTVLRGASAAALYGSQGQNGVILISTKKGKAGVTSVDFTSHFTTERPMYYPALQYEYAQTNAGNDYSWGAASPSPDHVKPFFQTGITAINTISLTAGSEKAQTYFSYSNTANKGILPTNTLYQNNVTFRETAKFGTKFSIDGKVIMSDQKVNNRMAGGLYFNPLTGLYLFPRGLNFDQYKNFEYYSAKRSLDLQDWWNINYDRGDAGSNIQQNPYWVLNRNVNSLHRQNLFSSITLKYALSNWLTLQTRGNVNIVKDRYDQKSYAGTQGSLADPNGRLVSEQNTNTLSYADLILSGERSLSGTINLTFNIGASIRQSELESFYLDSKGADLAFANQFTYGAINPTKSLKVFNEKALNSQTQSLFATTSIDYSKKVYLDLTVRNDWSSTLAYTDKARGGYFYFSTGLNTLISDLVTLPGFITFAKARVSYAKVGNGVAEYSTLPTNTFNAGNLVQINSGLLNPEAKLKPEDHRAREAGLEVRLFNDRLTFDGTYYQTNTYDQYFLIGANRGSGRAFTTVNAGNVENSGVEIAAGYDVVKNPSFSWNTGFNFTKNTNQIVSLPDQLQGGTYEITAPGVNNYGLYISLGGQFGDIYGKKFQRDPDGKMVVDATGKPQPESGGLAYLGNPIPKALLGWSNAITYQSFTINLLIDARLGGKVMSITQALLDEYGVSKASADARHGGGVDIPAVVSNGTDITGTYSGKLPAELFYTSVGGRAGITEYYMYDATTIRWRELSLGYRLPVKSKFIKSASLSLIGRNLFFFYKKAPFDPEISMSTGNGVQGIDVAGLPSTRSLGLSLRCSF